MNKTKSRLRKVLKFVWDCFEVYLPAVLIFGLFATFVLQIFMRYVLRSPLTWSFELTLFLYVYVVLLGSCNALRTNEHVQFTMVYDAVSPKVKAWMDVISAILIVIIFTMAMPSVIYYSLFIKVASMKKTTVLRIPYKYMYMAFLYMLWSSGCLQIVRAVQRFRTDILCVVPKKEEGGL